MRRLPVYFVLDVSESMVGEPLRQVEEGMSGFFEVGAWDGARERGQAVRKFFYLSQRKPAGHTADMKP